MSEDFRLLMIGAMYENGGNTSHRLLDGHPSLYVYPFESQIGTRLVVDELSSVFPLKYRWPVFSLDGNPVADFRAIIDEETKVRARTPNVSKFRSYPFELDDDERCSLYEGYVRETGRSTANNVAAFYRATFDAWKDHRASGREEVYVGYSPIITVDAEKLLEALPQAHFLHVVRNPWSGYADTKRRPVPLSLRSYMLAWRLNQDHAVLCRQLYPDRFHLVRTEDVLDDPVATLGAVLERLDLEAGETLRAPSWNGNTLEQVYPWGTIRVPTGAANRATAAELSADERAEVALRAGPYLQVFGYQEFLAELG